MPQAAHGHALHACEGLLGHVQPPSHGCTSTCCLVAWVSAPGNKYGAHAACMQTSGELPDQDMRAPISREVQELLARAEAIPDNAPQGAYVVDLATPDQAPSTAPHQAAAPAALMPAAGVAAPSWLHTVVQILAGFPVTARS